MIKYLLVITMKEPLAFKLRPDRLDDVLGQEHLTGENMILRRCVEQQRLFSGKG